MKAVSLTPGTNRLHLVERPDPSIASPADVKVRILRVGICGTDREEASGGRALAPQGKGELIIGHEMLGQVVEVGKQVQRVKPGDLAVFTVRRGCGHCLPCSVNREDMCRSGDFLERGIWGLDGYQTEYVVDQEQYIIRVPPEIESIGVLTEPLSVIEKAIDETIRIQRGRLPGSMDHPNWIFNRNCLVAGLGPIGLLACLVLVLRGANVYGLDIVEPNSARPSWLAEIGGKYIDGRQVPAEKVDEAIGPMDVLLDATGIADLEFNLLDALDRDGIYVLTGIPNSKKEIQIPGSELLRQMVIDNQIMFGSVNASRDHFQMAVNDLLNANLRWGKALPRLITHHFLYTDFEAALHHHEENEIKVVLEWS